MQHSLPPPCFDRLQERLGSLIVLFRLLVGLNRRRESRIPESSSLIRGRMARLEPVCAVKRKGSGFRIAYDGSEARASFRPGAKARGSGGEWAVFRSNRAARS